MSRSDRGTSSRTHVHDHVSTTSAPDAVVVHGQGVRVDRVDSELPLAEVRSRFGGLDVPAAIGGALAALGTALVLSAPLAALGLLGGEDTGTAEQRSIAAAVAGLVVLALSCLLGGWVAGRMARYDGLRNGLLTGLLVLLALVVAGLAGASLLDDVRPPLSRDDLGIAALVGTLAALVVTLGAGALGGRLGAAWHRRVDDRLLGTRAGGVAPYPTGTAAPAPAATAAAATSGPAPATRKPAASRRSTSAGGGSKKAGR